MGHQLNYYLLPEDTRILGQRLLEKCPLLVLDSKTQRPSPVVFRDFEEAGFGKTRLWLILAPEDALSSIQFEHIERQGYWLVDSTRSPVIEMSGCFHDGKIVRSGRLYYERHFLDNGRWVEKPEAFQTWAKKVLSVARKSLQRIPNSSFYIGLHALAAEQQGLVKRV